MYPTPESINTTTQLLVYVNDDLLNGYLGVGILLLIWMIIFTRLLVSRSQFAFASASFFTGLVSVLLWAIGILDDYFLLVTLAITVMSAIFLISKGRSGES